jgi:hypothetical protein
MDPAFSVFIGSLIGGIILILWRMRKKRHIKNGRCPKCKTKLQKEILEYGFEARSCPNGHGSADINDHWYGKK